MAEFWRIEALFESKSTGEVGYDILDKASSIDMDGINFKEGFTEVGDLFSELLLSNQYIIKGVIILL